MRRRDFLVLAGATAAAWPLAARAQQQARPVPRAPGGRPWIIGFLTTETEAESEASSLGPFRRGLADLGYAEGRDFALVVRYARGDLTVLPRLAREMVGLSAQVLLTNGVNALAALQEARATVPIVTYIGGAGINTMVPTLIGNVARPVGNVTGIINDSLTLSGKHCDLALEIVPNAKRIGALASATTPDASKGIRDAVGAAAATRGFEAVFIDVASGPEVAGAFRALADRRVDFVVVGSGMVFGDRSIATRAAAAAGLPAIYNEQGYVDQGGLISYGFNRAATFARLASFAELILSGVPVADIPAEEVSTWTMAINLKTAKSLGLTIPPTVLFRADVVIE
jgi:putative ABC transport system substrate-binding protein